MPAKAHVCEATPQIKNRILVALTKPEYRRLLPDLKFVELPSGKVLYEAGERIDYVYYMNNGMTSLIAVTENGSSVEVGVKKQTVGDPIKPLPAQE
jgi:CRP-like cAMP-binding protein